MHTWIDNFFVKTLLLRTFIRIVYLIQIPKNKFL
jgi:hypothetical protein